LPGRRATTYVAKRDFWRHNSPVRGVSFDAEFQAGAQRLREATVSSRGA
jgi:hypothetical protein